MSRTLIQLLLSVVLLCNGAAGSIAVARASEPAAISAHAHCAEMAMQEENLQTPLSDDGSGDNKHASDACCKAGSCHCGSMSLIARTLQTVNRVRMLVAWTGSIRSSAPLSPVPARHFRPPIA